MSEPPASPAPVPTGESPSAPQHFRVGAFDGPLDLLLHLVRINEVEITDIPIAEITVQYNAHLDLLRELNLEVAGEYVVLAATLMHIKSRMLLPSDPQALGEEDGADPRAELARQLLDYQRFKQAAENLQAMEARRSLVWTRDGIPREFADEELLAVDMFDLMSAFQQLLGRLGEEARIQLRRDSVSVADKMRWLTELLERQRSVNLLELLTDLPSRLDRVATFLAVLELIHRRVIVVFQRRLFDEIRVALRAAEGEP